MPPRRLRTARSLSWLAVSALALAQCTWEPLTRPIIPELVLEGDMRVDASLDFEGRRVFVEERLGETSRWHLVETEGLKSCVLPEGRPLARGMYAPRFRGDDVPKVLFPVRRRVGEVDELWLSDEKCRASGPFGALGDRDPDILQLRGDGRSVALVLGPDGSLRLFDPWTATTTKLADAATAWASVTRSETGPRAREVEALWIVDAGRLTQRALDGTLLVSMGQSVSGFDQRVSPDGNRLRVAYRDGSDVYEALSPDYAPVRIATDACGPEYVGDALDVHTPVTGRCDLSQLVRVEGGQVKFFPPGVYRIYPQGDLTLQFVFANGETELWIAQQSGARVKLMPTPRNAISILDGVRLAARTDGRRFGFWSLRSGYQQVLDEVDDIVTFRVDRSNQHRWMIFREEVDAEGGRTGIGKLYTFTERAANRALETGTPVELSLLAEGVPRGTYAWRGVPFLQEPIVLTYEQSRVQLDEDGNVRHWVGTLHARLLSGGLGSRVDENVTTSTLILAPVPGVLYAVTEGSRRGLWFAAL